MLLRDIALPNIEDVAAATPEKIIKEHVDPLMGFQAWQGRKIAAARAGEAE